MKRIEVHLHCVKSLTANPQWTERVHIFMRTMCKDGFLNGWLNFKDVGGNPPHFKIINLDWRSEKAIIELEEDLPWSTDDVLLCLAHEHTFNKDVLGFVPGKTIGGYFVHRSDFDIK